MTDHPKPALPLKSIFFYPNNMVAVCDEKGEQVPRYQGNQREGLAAMKADGVDWKQIPERYGAPSLWARKGEGQASETVTQTKRD